MPLLGLDFPEYQPDTLYIVNEFLYRAAINTERTTLDFLLPEVFVRDETGKRIGFKALRRLG